MWSSLLVLMLLTGPSKGRDLDAAKKFDCAAKVEKMERSCDKKCQKKKGKDRSVCQDVCAEGVKSFEDTCKELKKNQGRMGKSSGGGGGNAESEDLH